MIVLRIVAARCTSNQLLTPPPLKKSGVKIWFDSDRIFLLLSNTINLFKGVDHHYFQMTPVNPTFFVILVIFLEVQLASMFILVKRSTILTLISTTTFLGRSHNFTLCAKSWPVVGALTNYTINSFICISLKPPCSIYILAQFNRS